MCEYDAGCDACVPGNISLNSNCGHSSAQIMRIMCAVPMDHAEAKSTMLQSPGSSLVALAQGDFSHEGPWRKLKEDGRIVHDEGVLEVTPGLSEEEPESDDERPYRSVRSVRIVGEKGPRLTTFSFSCAGGEGPAFQYTLENANTETSMTRIEEVSDSR